MARPNLGNLLSVASSQATGEDDAAITEPATAEQAPKPPRKATATRKNAIAPAKTAHSARHWTDYERLEARLRDDQVERLDVLTRRLNKRRDKTGERITKNSLLRIAVDLLLERQDDMAGATELEILTSLH